MTRNQIEYNEHLRKVRADQETARSNLEKERQGRDTIDESVRHNQATEDVAYKSLDEQTRHNKASEALGHSNVALGYANIAQADRQLAELSRHNQQQEYLQGVSIDNQSITADQNYNVNLYKANIAYDTLTEQIRHNKQLESQGLQNIELGYDRLQQALTDTLMSPFKFVLGGLDYGSTTTTQSKSAKRTDMQWP